MEDGGSAGAESLGGNQHSGPMGCKQGGDLTTREHPVGPHPLERKRPRRAAYILPTLFTSGNIFLGFIALVQAFQGAILAASGVFGFNPHFSLAAKALGF